MRMCIGAAAVAATAALTACGTAEEQRTASHHGRYLGIGVYPAGSMWSRITLANRRDDQALATTADDEQVIVVVDSHTGEVRQCGNLTGHCIGMNPWTGALGQAQSTPVRVDQHASDIEDGSAEADIGPAEAVGTNVILNAQSR